MGEREGAIMSDAYLDHLFNSFISAIQRQKHSVRAKCGVARHHDKYLISHQVGPSVHSFFPSDVGRSTTPRSEQFLLCSVVGEPSWLAFAQRRALGGTEQASKEFSEYKQEITAGKWLNPENMFSC